MFVATRYATKKCWAQMIEKALFFRIGPFLMRRQLIETGDQPMETGNFYFLSDQYFIDFPDQYLMKNKESIDGNLHNRPCFYAFQDEHTGLYWMIPFTSKVDKFKKIHDQKVAKYGTCDTILFGNVLGHQKAFLIQNMCPITPKYISSQYTDCVSGTPVKVDRAFDALLKRKAKRVLAKQRRGLKLIFPDVLRIEKALLGTT
jgi:hypothetical protein